MCWSIGATAAMVAAGSAATVYTARIKLPPAIWLTMGYFTVMEGLQLAGYYVIDSCGSPANQAVVLLSYLHIVFQPFFINAFAMQLLPQGVRANISRWVYGLCFLSAIFMLMKLYPLEWAGNCRIGQPLCGRELCVTSGNWHIAWSVPYNGLANFMDDLFGLPLGFPAYVFAAFILPLAYGSWRFVVFHIVTGPLLARELTDNINEQPAVWCLFSIGILLFALFPKLLNLINVKSWWPWPTSWHRYSD